AVATLSEAAVCSTPSRRWHHRLLYRFQPSGPQGPIPPRLATMSVPQVVIVGRPNVGKSSLLNWLAGRRISIVDDQAGVTRDRISTLIEHDGRYFELIDTGGIGIEDTDNLTAEVEKQIQLAIESAAVLIYVVDV